MFTMTLWSLQYQFPTLYPVQLLLGDPTAWIFDDSIRCAVHLVDLQYSNSLVCADKARMDGTIIAAIR